MDVEFQAVDFFESKSFQVTGSSTVLVSTFEPFEVAPSSVVTDEITLSSFYSQFTEFHTNYMVDGQVPGHPVLFEPPSLLEFGQGVMLPGDGTGDFVGVSLLDGLTEFAEYEVVPYKVSGTPLDVTPMEFPVEWKTATAVQTFRLNKVDWFERKRFTVKQGLIYFKTFGKTEFKPMVVDSGKVLVNTFSTFEYKPYSVTAGSVHNVDTMDLFESPPNDAVLHIEDINVLMPPARTHTGFFPYTAVSVERTPVRFKLPESVLGGRPTENFLAPQQSFYRAPTAPTREQLVSSRVSGFINDYITADDAVYSTTFYRGFYITNDTGEEVDTLDFWIDGGSVYTAGGLRIREAEFQLEDAERDYGVTLPDSFVESGATRTSLFDQIKVEYLLEKELQAVNDDAYFRNRKFTPGNQMTRIDKLLPGESQGVYLKITTLFKPDFPVHSDYVFFHVRYNVDNTEEMYPGGQGLIILPSIYIKISANFGGLESELASDVDYLYSRYPTFFARKEDAQ